MFRLYKVKQEVLEDLDMAFTVLFGVEALLKIFAFTFR